MTLGELLQYLAGHLSFDVLDGDAAATLAKAQAGSHRNQLMGAIIKHMAEGAGCAGIASPITRAQATTSLGPLRLQYMKDDAPVEGFRMIEQTVHAIDGAFNDEALREKERR